MHSYSARVAWAGSTGEGYDAYDRRHGGISSAGFNVPLSSDVGFKGDPACLSPEELLVMAAASCQLLSFLAVAARARLDVVGYRDEALGVMPETALTQITLRPHITITSTPAHPVDEARVRHLCEVAHHECYIANSLLTEVQVLPTVTIGSEGVTPQAP